jgi:hypothetical protein
VDCYKECWGCGLASSQCEPVVNACLDDVACKAYYECKNKNCCDEDNNCLEGDAWAECMSGCYADANLSRESFEKFAAIDKCVACDACTVSCSEKHSLDFKICIPEDVANSPLTECYEEKAPEGEAACFSWAGWGGPCTWDTMGCKYNAECSKLDEDINATWGEANYVELQEELFTAASEEVVTLYWAYMQCIYCYACTESKCEGDAGSKNCEEYESPFE